MYVTDVLYIITSYLLFQNLVALKRTIYYLTFSVGQRFGYSLGCNRVYQTGQYQGMAGGGLASRFLAFFLARFGFFGPVSRGRPALLAMGACPSGSSNMATRFLRVSKWVKPGREREQDDIHGLCNLISVTSRHFGHILFVRSKFLPPSHTQRKGIAGKCELQESDHWGPFWSCLLYLAPRVNGSLPILICPGGPFPIPVRHGELGPHFPRSPYF